MTQNKLAIQRKLLMQLEEIHHIRYNKLLIELSQLEDELDKNRQGVKLLQDQLGNLGHEERKYYTQVYQNDFCNKISSIDRRKIYSTFNNFITQKNSLEIYIAELNEQTNLLNEQISAKQAQIRHLVIKKEKFIELRKFT